MKTNMLDDKFNPRYLMISIFTCWIIYSFLYLSLVKNESSPIAGCFALLGQVSLDILASYLTFKLYRTVKDPRTKNIYFLFFISFISAVFADGIYNFGMNILDIKYFSNINSFFEVPFLFFLLFQVIAWGNIFFLQNNDIKYKSKHLYMPYIMVSILIFFMFIFGIPWNIKYFSLLGVYQLIDTILEVVGFTLVTTCLARSKDITISLASVGYLIIISSDLLIRYNVVSGIIPFLNPFETTWVLGLIMMVTSFFFVKRKVTLHY